MSGPVPDTVALAHSCFNLVIEMLFMSGYSPIALCEDVGQFQSRHRDAFHVRDAETFPIPERDLECFNLVIEMLVISGNPYALRRRAPLSCFNLVIEMLVISG